MNKDNDGRCFEYPYNLILFLGTLKVTFHLGYREGEGVARSIALLTDIPIAEQAVVKKVFIYGAYDSGECFEWLAAHQIEAGILLRQNTRPSLSGARSKMVTACQQNRIQR